MQAVGRVLLQKHCVSVVWSFTTRVLPCYSIPMVKTDTADAHMVTILPSNGTTVTARLPFLFSPTCIIPLMSTFSVETKTFKNPKSLLPSSLSEKFTQWRSELWPMASSPAVPVTWSNLGSGPLTNCLLSGRYNAWRCVESNMIQTRVSDKAYRYWKKKWIEIEHVRKEVDIRIVV